MRMRILFVVSALVVMAFAYPDYSRPIVSSEGYEEHLAGQLVIQLDPSQRGMVRLSQSEGVALFGIGALDELSRKWHVADVEPLMRKPHPTAIDRKYGLDLLYVVQFDADQDITPVAGEYRSLPQVEFVSPNIVMRHCEEPNDALFANQWHYQNLGAATAWGIVKGDTRC